MIVIEQSLHLLLKIINLIYQQIHNVSTLRGFKNEQKI